MGKRIWLLLPGFLVLLVLVAVTLPAALLAPRLDLPPGLTQIRGTVWSGTAQWRQTGRQPLALKWRWRGGRHWHWQASGGQTALEGRWQPGSKARLPEIHGRLDLDRLDLIHWLQIARPVGWLDLALTDAVLAAGRAPQAAGKVVWRQAGLAGSIQEPLGEIEILAENVDEALRLEIRSLQPASVQVRGSISFQASRYDADLWLRAAAGRPELTAALADIGELQPDGQVRLRIGGRTGL
ncbi:type II secretion system protein N [Wenzhouxiangella limi]|uniref:Type II secretion system protein N n=1 Tax=Wenzhouxiangella limi TaxID=2707351 RepID=A0A845V081_9GAMM|nr:type II secretion system protein N [Wenzhouxiangella limi]NDY96458.1 type II secretion system protein N [Wenzhouxiangella limi]